MRAFHPHRSAWSALAGDLIPLAAILVTLLVLTLSGFVMAPRIHALLEDTNEREWRVILQLNTLAIDISLGAVLLLAVSRVLLSSQYDICPYVSLFLAAASLITGFLLVMWLARMLAKLVAGPTRVS